MKINICKECGCTDDHACIDLLDVYTDYEDICDNVEIIAYCDYCHDKFRCHGKLVKTKDKLNYYEMNSFIDEELYY